jgi:hypothetical protein
MVPQLPMGLAYAAHGKALVAMPPLRHHILHAKHNYNSQDSDFDHLATASSLAQQQHWERQASAVPLWHGYVTSR